MKERLEQVFREVFDLESSADVHTLRQVTAERWDSLGHVTLVAALESEFGIELSIGESLELTSFQAAHMLLEDKLGEHT